MDIKIEPLKEEELDDFVKMQWAAFEPLEANMIMPMIFQNGLQEDLMERFRRRTLRITDGNLVENCFTAKDINSGEVLGIAWWDRNEDPPETKAEIDEAYNKAHEQREHDPPVQGMNKELDQAYYRASFYSEMQTVAGRPYTCLRVLAVSPKHHRRGVGTKLLRQGLEKADRLGLPVYLDCGVMGKPLYERYGFKNVGDFPLNCLDYGGRSDGRHWLMWRPAKGSE